MTRTMRKAWQFFMENAGYCTPPGRAACALELAKAEQWARDNGIEFKWEEDALPWDGECDRPFEVLCCSAEYEGQTVSLCGIGMTGRAREDATARRVYEAELAQELCVDFFTAVANHIQQL